MELPTWLNVEFLQRVLKLTVLDYHVEPAVPQDSNFLSVLYRVRVHYMDPQPRTKSVIVKIPPVSEPFLQFVKDVRAFRTETLVYQKLGPPLVPKCFPCDRDDVLVLEDLKPLGYHMADRRQRLDLQQSCSVLRTLARFHGLSAGDPSVIKLFPESQFIERNRDNEEQFILNNMNRQADNVENWPELAHYAPRIRAASKGVFDKMMQVVQPKKDSFCVLNHGDCWVNNILFSGSGDCVLIDFQMCRYASPALDLQYFIYTSVQEEVRSQHLDQLLHEYHRVLNSTLGSQTYSKNTLKKEFHDKQYFGFITAVSKLDIVLRDSLLLRQAFGTLLPHFDQLGLL